MEAPTNGKRFGYSADVRIHLYLNGETLLIGQLAPDFIILRNPIVHGPAEAEISLSIDGDVERWKVQLPHGIRLDQVKTPIEPFVESAVA